MISKPKKQRREFDLPFGPPAGSLIGKAEKIRIRGVRDATNPNISRMMDAAMALSALRWLEANGHKRGCECAKCGPIRKELMQVKV